MPPAKAGAARVADCSPIAQKTGSGIGRSPGSKHKMSTPASKM